MWSILIRGIHYVEYLLVDAVHDHRRRNAGIPHIVIDRCGRNPRHVWRWTIRNRTPVTRWKKSGAAKAFVLSFAKHRVGVDRCRVLERRCFLVFLFLEDSHTDRFEFEFKFFESHILEHIFVVLRSRGSRTVWMLDSVVVSGVDVEVFTITSELLLELVVVETRGLGLSFSDGFEFVAVTGYSTAFFFDLRILAFLGGHDGGFHRSTQQKS